MFVAVTDPVAEIGPDVILEEVLIEPDADIDPLTSKAAEGEAVPIPTFEPEAARYKLPLVTFTLPVAISRAFPFAGVSVPIPTPPHDGNTFDWPFKPNA